MRTVRLTLVTLAVAVLAGGAPLRAQRRGNVLSTEEIERAKSNVGTAYDLVQTLRPRWLQVHELTRLPGRADEPVGRTVIGDNTRVTYHATVFSGVQLGHDARACARGRARGCAAATGPPMVRPRSSFD